ncbi:MAG: hypothetical protein ACI9LX_002122 [Paraglaciecola sp.]|jgi:hypothetical protein
MYQDRLQALLQADPLRMDILHAVATVSLPDCWLAAGFVRNLVWDHLHNKKTDLNDVDVIYYCQTDTQGQLAKNAIRQLQEKLPKVNWQVKNQALMHIKRQNSQYTSSTDAMTFWPEQETAIGVSLDKNECFYVVAPFGLASVFEGRITFNPKGDEDVFWQRIEKKHWLTIWPQLTIENTLLYKRHTHK